MDSKYIHVQALQLTPKDANIISANLFGFHCNSNNSYDYAESIAFHFMCAIRTKELYDTTNKKYIEYGIEEQEIEKYVRKKLLLKFVRKYYGKYKVKTVKNSSTNCATKNVYIKENIFNEYNVSTVTTQIKNEYRVLSQSLYEKIVNNAKSVFFSKQTQNALINLISKDEKWLSQDLNEEMMNIKTNQVLEAFFNTIKSANIYLPEGNTNFTIKLNGKMTMLEKNKNTYINESGKWSTKNRIEIKYGKGLRRIMEFIVQTYKGDKSWFEIIKTDSFIEQYVNKLKAIYNPTIEIQHVKGYDIKHWYYGLRYAEENIGTLSQSCMRGKSQQDYFNIYNQNPDKVEMIIAQNQSGKLIGRAILWRLDHANGSENNMFMDRIYGNEIIIEKFKQYAKENKYWYKVEQTYSSNKVYAPDGTVQRGDFWIELKNTDNELYPYMDTMQEATDVYADTITLYSGNSGDGSYVLNSTDGKWEDYENEDEIYVERYGDYYHRDDVIWSDVYDTNIVTEEARETYHGDYVWYDDEDYVVAYDTDALHYIDDVGYSDYDGCYYMDYVDCEVHGIIGENQSTRIELENNEYIVHSDVSEEELADVLGIEIEENE